MGCVFTMFVCSPFIRPYQPGFLLGRTLKVRFTTTRSQAAWPVDPLKSAKPQWLELFSPSEVQAVNSSSLFSKLKSCSKHRKQDRSSWIPHGNTSAGNVFAYSSWLVVLLWYEALSISTACVQYIWNWELSMFPLSFNLVLLHHLQAFNM